MERNAAFLTMLQTLLIVKECVEVDVDYFAIHLRFMEGKLTFIFWRERKVFLFF